MFIKLIKKTPAIVFLFLLLFSVVGVSVFVPKSASALNSNLDMDTKRSKIYAAHWCLLYDNGTFLANDDSSPSGSVDDLYDKLFDADGKDRKVVVGFKVQQDDGVISCKDAVLDGLKAIGNPAWPDDQAIKQYAILRLSGSRYPGENVKASYKSSTIRNNAKTMAGELWNNDINPIGEPNDSIKRWRILNAPKKGQNLVNTCYSASRDSFGTDNPNANFEASGIKFTFKDALSVKDIPWVDQGNQGDLDDNIANIPLGFGSNVSNPFEKLSSDFYPLGHDFPGVGGNDRTTGGIVDCNYVKANAHWIFAGNVKLDGDKIIFDDPTGALPSANNGGSSSDADATDSCEAGINAALSWAVCGMLGLLDSGVNALYDAALSMLTVKQSDFNDPEGNLYKVWSYFRRIASILLLAIGLVMIIGQAVNKD